MDKTAKDTNKIADARGEVLLLNIERVSCIFVM